MRANSRKTKLKNGFAIKGIYVIKKWCCRLQVRLIQQLSWYLLRTQFGIANGNLAVGFLIYLYSLNQACGQADEVLLFAQTSQGPPKPWGSHRMGWGRLHFRATQGSLNPFYTSIVTIVDLT